MKDYTNLLCLKLQEIHKPIEKIEFKITMEQIRIDLNRAIPLGLILNELITNALKHAFPKKTMGKITISIKKLKDKPYEVIVQDNGVGLPADLNFKKTDTLGLKLINILTEQLDGTVSIKRLPGTKVKITFPSLKK
jgi:two-component sensor histidine kinase